MTAAPSLALKDTQGNPMPDDYGRDVVRHLASMEHAYATGTTVDGGVILSHRTGVWLLLDNGGEVAVRLLNRSGRDGYVAYHHDLEGWQEMPSAGTLAYRIVQVLRGNAVDYETVWEEIATP